jgi:hypothetical protein
MTPSIVPFEADLHRSLVDEFNDTLARHRYPLFFTPTPPHDPTKPLSTHSFVVLDKNKVVGVYKLKEQIFKGAKTEEKIGMYQIPISAGIYDPTYTMVGFQCLRDCLKRSEKLFCLGMGSRSHPVARMVHSLKWRLNAVPFYFCVLSPERFFKNLPILQKKLGKFLALAAFLRLPQLAFFLFNFIKPDPVDPSVITLRVEHFGGDADNVWEKAKPYYDFIGIRNSEALNLLYPDSIPEYHRLEIRQAGQCIGWGLVFGVQMKNDSYFGNLKVGFIADFLSLWNRETHVISACKHYLKQLQCDVIVTNQCHYKWQRAFSRSGFLKGPSNFYFASSKKLTEALGESYDVSRLFLTRGDNEGPESLLRRGTPL